MTDQNVSDDDAARRNQCFDEVTNPPLLKDPPDAANRDAQQHDEGQDRCQTQQEHTSLRVQQDGQDPETYAAADETFKEKLHVTSIMCKGTRCRRSRRRPSPPARAAGREGPGPQRKCSGPALPGNTSRQSPKVVDVLGETNGR